MNRNSLRRLAPALEILVATLVATSCAGPTSDSIVLTADPPLHLADHLDTATIEGSDVPEDLPKAVEWRFDEAQPGWKPAYGYEFSQKLVEPVRTSDALRVAIEEEHSDSDGDLCGYIYTDLPDLQLHEWGYVALEARAQPGIQGVRLAFNLTEPARAGVRQAFGRPSPMMADDTVQTYLLSSDPLDEFDGTWRQLILGFCASQPGAVDLLSVRILPKEATFASARIGVSMEAMEELQHRTLYMHAPGKITYQVRIPDSAQLDVGLGVIRRDAPVTFRVTATYGGDEPETRLEETVAETERWTQRRVDLSDLAGKTVSLTLEANAAHAGTVALWATPILSGSRTTTKPNVILYVIDGGDADFMSVYGYNRRTTPNLQELAAQGAVFERAYSNSSWTRPSTLSFLTSLQHSTLGGLVNNLNMAPDDVPTIAEHLSGAGYQTAFFTSNPNAGTISGLARGIDVLRDAGIEDTSTSSVELHEDFWRWREAYPAEPYWVRFQTTDVHGPNIPASPFGGVYVALDRRALYLEQQEKLGAEGGASPYSEAFAKTGISRTEFYDVARSLYDETMAQQDHQLGRLVERLKATGQWEKTLLIVASDHGHQAGSSHFGIGLSDPLPAVWGIGMASRHQTRIPLMFLWPGHIAGGQRFSEPVSMIDLLPTILDLLGLPPAEVAQGRSLAPLLFDRGDWEPRPVILDEFEVDEETGELRGVIEVIDGRWAASLLIDPNPDEDRVPLRGHHHENDAKDMAWEKRSQGAPALLLFDLWRDPDAFRSVHEERPDLVEKYTRFLRDQFDLNRELGKHFTHSEEPSLNPEQLEALRSLGYI